MITAVRRMHFIIGPLVALAVLVPTESRASVPRTTGQASACNEATDQPVLRVQLRGRVFKAIPTSDGCWIFASLQGRESAQSGIAVLRRSGGQVSLERIIPLETPSALVLTHDESLLIVANGDFVEFLGVDRIRSGFGEPKLGRLTGGRGSGESFVNVTGDDEFLFVSDHGYESVTVYALGAAYRSGFAIDPEIGTVPVGRAPLSTIFSPDGKTAYHVSEFAPSGFGWPKVCGNDPEGALIVIDVERAKLDPGRSIISAVPSGCTAVRLVLTSDGETAYVSARAGNEVLVFDTDKLRTDPENARISVIPVDNAPVGLALIENDQKVLVTSSRPGNSDPSEVRPLSVLETSRIGTGGRKIVGKVPAGPDPHEIVLTKDGRTLVVSLEDAVALFDINRLPVEPSP